MTGSKPGLVKVGGAVEPELPPLKATIGGRRYVEVGERATTFEHRLYMATALRAAGLADFLTGKASVADTAGIEAVLWRAVDSRKLWGILAGGLVAEGEEWTEEGADRLIPVLRKLTDDAEIRTLLALSITLVARFFVRGVGFGGTSASSSEPNADPAPSTRRRPRRKRQPTEAAAT